MKDTSGKKAKENKIPKSFRLPPGTVDHLLELCELLKESEVDVAERAIEYLYANREAVVNQDIEDRRAKAAQKQSQGKIN